MVEVPLSAIGSVVTGVKTLPEIFHPPVPLAAVPSILDRAKSVPKLRFKMNK